MADRSVIQMTQAAHADKLEDSLETCKKYLQLTTGMTDVEIYAYLRGAREFWAFATFNILHRGNCHFERGE